MKQVLQFRRSGQTRVVDVPAPLVPAGGLLVRNEWSLISPGTERMLTEAGGNLGLLNTARKRPDLVRQVVDKARSDGISATVEAVRTRIDVAVPLGYSCAGTVLDVGDRVEGFSAGERVACAGAGQANHAEVVGVPMRLATPHPRRSRLGRRGVRHGGRHRTARRARRGRAPRRSVCGHRPRTGRPAHGPAAQSGGLSRVRHRSRPREDRPGAGHRRRRRVRALGSAV